jgi:CRISPR/Cas system CSM-associated protein Csm2 small subunit
MTTGTPNQAALEAQLAKSSGRRDTATQELSDVLMRELREMLTNNQNIRNVLRELATVAGAALA